MARGLVAAAVAAAFASLVGDAAAYCRTSSCEDGQGALCTPASPKDCGCPLYWPTSCVGYSVQRDASDQVTLDDTRAIVAEAFQTWTSAECAGNPVGLTVEDLGVVSCDAVTYDAKTKNANVIMFRDDSWPYDGSAALALTTVTYVLETGEIRDADMEINSADATLTTSDTDVDVDLLSIVTHEVGHFLGLAHTPDTSATMFQDYPPKSITLRTLESDDIAGICAVYPPGNTTVCDSTPVNGLGDTCAEPAAVEEGCCAVKPGAPQDRGGVAATAALVCGLAVAVRRKRRARSTVLAAGSQR